MVSPLNPLPTRQALRKGTRNGKRGGQVSGVIGELLITVAVILGLYVVWQLWWTSYEVTPGIESRVEQFQQDHPTPPGLAPEQTEPAPNPEPQTDNTIIGVLHVPKWDWMQIPISNNNSQEILNLGNAGHYPETGQAGQIGNFALAGHRRTYGNNFRRVDILQPGDPLIVETAELYLVYEMTSYEIVAPSQVSVLLPVPNQPGVAPTVATMTMTTCHPEYGNTERYIVYSELKSWTYKTDGKPAVLQDEPAR